ncbi:MAG: formylglycine-generating enzyme family protein [Myxococcota bacterium]|nr:formylglycine-generating enzyme family protein [Myxococcota bacterium]
MSEIEEQPSFHFYRSVWEERLSKEPKAYIQLRKQYMDMYMDGLYEELALLMQEDLPFFSTFFEVNAYGNLDWAPQIVRENVGPFLHALCEIYHQDAASELSQFLVGGELDGVFSHQYGYHAAWPHIRTSEYFLVLQISSRMCTVSSGQFRMGALRTDFEATSREYPRHRVRLNYEFLMGCYPVTRLFFRHVMGYFPDDGLFDGDTSLREETTYGKDREWPSLSLPVSQVQWLEALCFCNRLSMQEGLEKVYDLPKELMDSPSSFDRPKSIELLGRISMNREADGYRLPTEAEWEYAARAGGNHTFAGGYDYTKIGWLQENSHHRRHPVGQKQSNHWGLFDMSGNVWEWCWEAFASSVAEGERFNRRKGRITLNPVGLGLGVERMSRGGAWNEPKAFAYLAFRHKADGYMRSHVQGFRIVRTLQKKNKDD